MNKRSVATRLGVLRQMSPQTNGVAQPGQILRQMSRTVHRLTRRSAPRRSIAPVHSPSA